MIKLADLIDRAAKLKRDDPTLRYGQSLMNALVDLDKATYDEITGSPFDPFYDDKRIGAFYSYLGEGDHAKAQQSGDRKDPTDDEEVVR